LANAVSITLVERDVTIAEPLAVDLVLVGDLFYDRRLAAQVTKFLDLCVADGIEVLVGDLGRKYLPHARLRALADYPVPDVGDPKSAAPRQGGVFAFQPAG
jgi:predicted nicotinamide N-methyase